MGPLGRVGFLRKVERCAGNAKMQVTVLSLRHAPQPQGAQVLPGTGGRIREKTRQTYSGAARSHPA